MQSLVMVVDCNRKHSFGFFLPDNKTVKFSIDLVRCQIHINTFFLMFLLNNIHVYMFSPTLSHLNTGLFVKVAAENSCNYAGTNIANVYVIIIGALDKPRALGYVFTAKRTFFYFNRPLSCLHFWSRPFALHHSLYR